MSILNFPSDPASVGNVYTGDNGITYNWDGEKWVGQASAVAASNIIISHSGDYTVSIEDDGTLHLPNYTLPFEDGMPNQTFVTDGMGTITWADMAGAATDNYRGFYAGVNRFYNTGDPTVSQIIINQSSASTFQNENTDTNQDNFNATGLTGSSTVAMVNLYGSNDMLPMSQSDIVNFTKSFIDVVLYSGGTTLETDLTVIRSNFYDNIATLGNTLTAGTLISNFAFMDHDVWYMDQPATNVSSSGMDATFNIKKTAWGDYNNVSINNRGSGYATNDTLAVTGDLLGGTTPDNDINIEVTGVIDGVVTDVNNLVSGSGYTDGLTYNCYNLLNTDPGQNLAVTVTVVSDVVTGVTIADGGNDYTSGTYAYIDGGSGYYNGAATVSITNPGSNYSDSTAVSTTGGYGSGLTVDIVTAGGAIAGVVINNPGQDYLQGDIVTIDTGDSNATISLDALATTLATLQTNTIANGVLGSANSTGTAGYTSPYYDPNNPWPQTYIADGANDQYDYANFIATDASLVEFTGEITDNVLTVSSVVSGTFAVGQHIRYNDDSSDGFVLTAFDTGTGDTGTYFLDSSDNISSQTMYAYGINYGNGQVVSNSAFGNGSSYVTVYDQSIFAIIANNAAIDAVYYDGNMGADSSGFKDVNTVFASSASMLTNGDFTLSLGSDGLISLPNQAMIGNVYMDSNGSVDLFAPESLRWAGINWANSTWMYVEQDYAGIEVLKDSESVGGEGWLWYFNNDATTIFPNNTIDSYGNASLSIKTHEFTNHNTGSSYTWTFGNDGSLTLPDMTKMNSGGVGVTNSAEFGTEIVRDGGNNITHTEVYMGAGTTETRGIVDDMGHGLIYTGVENPGFAGMVAIDPLVTSQYAISANNGNILIGSTQLGGTITTTDYRAGLGVLNNNLTINGFYADQTSVTMAASAEGSANNSLQMGSSETDLYTLYGNAYTLTSQTATYWETYSEDDNSGPNQGYSWIQSNATDPNDPYVFIENTRNSDGISKRWTFGSDGSLTLPNGGVIPGATVLPVNSGVTAVNYYQYDGSDLTISINIGDVVNFPNFSGQILINELVAGQVDMWLVGGAATYLVGSSKTGDPAYAVIGTMAVNGGVNGYSWTSNIVSLITFTAVRTRSGA